MIQTQTVVVLVWPVHVIVTHPIKDNVWIRFAQQKSGATIRFVVVSQSNRKVNVVIFVTVAVVTVIRVEESVVIVVNVLIVVVIVNATAALNRRV